MSLLYVAEYSTFGVDANTGHPVGKEPSFDQTPIAIGGSSNPSQPFGKATKLVRVHCDAICSIAFGGAVATNQNKRLAANQTEYFFVTAGDTVSVITNT